MSATPKTSPLDQFLPQTFRWSSDVRPTNIQSPKPGAWHVVTVTRHDNDIEFDAPKLPQMLKDQLLEQCQTLNWKGQSHSLRLVMNQTPWLLVVVRNHAWSSAQKGRQVGLDVAAALKDLPAGTELVLSAADSVDVLDVWEGLALGWYDTAFFKGVPTALNLPKAVHLFGQDVSDTGADERVSRIQAALLTKALQDAPANWLDPERFMAIARDLLPAIDGMTLEVINRAKMAELGMGAFLSVAVGSNREAYCVIARIPGANRQRTVAIIGKGVTFDSGGINIKPSAGLDEMKYDMSGAAATLGAAFYLSRHRPPVNVVCALGLVENMPSGTATRPGDIVKSHSGKTIEVLNTDAEGRLVLCDMISYVLTQDKPQTLYTIATLTGAVVQALGHAGAAVMTEDPGLARFVNDLSAKCGEPFWQLPMWPELKKELKSKAADLKNIPKPNVLAGAIIGGIFLGEFMKDKALKWAHLDIAGTAWSCAATGFPGGGSSFGVRTLIDACRTPHE